MGEQEEVSMKKLYVAVVSFLLICCFTNCGISSAKLVKAEIPWQLKDISMYDENQGWALTNDNEILFTDSGIDNFSPIWKFERVSAAADYFVDICFADMQNVYASYFSEDGDLTVEYTKDGGKNWRQTLVKSEDGMMEEGGSAYISFSDTENGYLLYCSSPAAGQMKKVLFYSTDAGESFSCMGELSEISGYPQGMTVSKEKSYIAVSPRSEEQYLYVRKADTDQWTGEEIILLPEKARYMEGLAPVFHIEHKQEGMMVSKAVGDEILYLLFVTKDGGENWQQKEEIPLNSVKAYSYVNDSRIYLIDDTGALYQYFSD